MQPQATRLAPLRTPLPKDGQCVPFTLVNLFPNMLVDATPRGYSFADIEACFGLKLVGKLHPKTILSMQKDECFVALINVAAAPPKPAHLIAALLGLHDKGVVLIDTVLSDSILANSELLSSMVVAGAVQYIAGENGFAKAFKVHQFSHLINREK